MSWGSEQITGILGSILGAIGDGISDIGAKIRETAEYVGQTEDEDAIKTNKSNTSSSYSSNGSYKQKTVTDSKPSNNDDTYEKQKHIAYGRNASFIFGKPHFSTYDQGLRGISFPYTLKLNSHAQTPLIVTAKFCDSNGLWIRSNVTELSDDYGDALIKESLFVDNNNYSKESYLFLPYGVLDLPKTQEISIIISVCSKKGIGEEIIKFSYHFDYYIYENDPREPQFKKKPTDARYSSSSNSKFNSSSSSSSKFNSNSNSNSNSSSSSSSKFNSSSSNKTEYTRTTNSDFPQPGVEELIGLIAHVIKADGVTAPEEIRTVVDFFNSAPQFDKEKVRERLKYNLSHLPDIKKCCKVLRDNYNTQGLLTFVGLFFNIATSDSKTPYVEIKIIGDIALALGIPASSFNALKNSFIPNYRRATSGFRSTYSEDDYSDNSESFGYYDTSDSTGRFHKPGEKKTSSSSNYSSSYSSSYKDDYSSSYNDYSSYSSPENPLWKMFGLTSKATKRELKHAYHEKCKLYHPDKYANASEARRKEAEEIFKNYQAAYEELLKEF